MPVFAGMTLRLRARHRCDVINPDTTKNPSRLAVFGWVLFEWATQPYFTLVTTFVYAPFFAAAVAPDPAEGQALWGFATSAAGLMIAVLAPLLGAVADAAGRRKPWIAAFGVLIVAGCDRCCGSAGRDIRRPSRSCSSPSRSVRSACKARSCSPTP